MTEVVPTMSIADARNLSILGGQWVRGALVNWSQLHGHRRPNLVGLPSYPFAPARHWVPWESNGLETTSMPSVPIYQKTWIPVDDDPVLDWAQGPVLCLFHQGSEAVAKQLAAEIGPEVLLLREGKGREDGIPTFVDTVSGLAAMTAILESSPSLSGWVDLCDLYRQAEESTPWLARLGMLQQLLRSLPLAKLRILHITRGLQELEGPPPSLAGARIAGVVRMLGSEHRHVAATTIDIDQAEDVVCQIAAELRYHAPSEVCYRHQQRYRPELSAISVPKDELQLDPKKVYIVTGGVRGLGAEVAKRLLKRGARQLALMGRRQLPPKSQWGDPNLPDHTSEAIETIRNLENAGVRVALYNGSLTERSQLDAFLARVRGLGEIGGIVHCAGHFPSDLRPFFGLDLADLQSVFEPKVEGLETLAELCACDRPSFFLLFSSVAAVFPALASGVADYAAANAFMDWFASYQVRTGKPWFRSVNWPSWRGAGKTDSEPPAYQRLGLGSLDVESGKRLLEGILCRPTGGTLLVCPGCHPDTEPSQLLELPEHDVEVEATTPPLANEEATNTQPVSDSAVSIPPWLVTIFAENIGIPEKDLDPEIPFSELGIESIILTELLKCIEEHVGQPLEPNLLFEHPSLATLGAGLTSRGYINELKTPTTEQVTSKKETQTPTKSLHRPSKRMSSEQPIAVVGMACRFPDAANVTEFWDNLRAGHCAIAEVPSSRWEHPSIYRPHFEEGKSISKWGGFIPRIEDFDPAYFKMSDEEAIGLDPAIRLILEEVENCLAEAGYSSRELWGRNVGVFVGARMSDYWRRVRDRYGSAGFGSDQNFIAARVAHHLNLTGPNFVIDSACSSSLVAVQLAVRSLQTGESELALVGGVDVLLDERPYIEFSAARALSPSGRCYVFDERADGFVPGEGCGMLLLKQLDHALRDGDRIHALIRSVAVNNDGHTIGLTTPNPTAQAAVIRHALEQSGLRAEEIAMIEAHGTGTMLGDPIELRALTDVFSTQTSKSGFCAVGSVKSNLGHLLSAAGIAGLLKILLSLEHGEIPATLFCEQPNPRFDFAHSPFHPNTRLQPWPTDRPLRAAGVSAFGLGGTNAHLIATAFDPSLRVDTAQVRCMLPPPVFQRRRLWLDREPAIHTIAATVTPNNVSVSSILDLQFVDQRVGERIIEEIYPNL